ncbi:sigma factor [Pseudoclavibacter sp. RFBG4]|uniref:sigma factor n=1 Tax=Pseudoclavibacter sp. RFBG4 TaxID=2080575 RepID=UPI0011B0908E|nr:sigma factor [Pseudoclavibacter sp. RFBG4]
MSTIVAERPRADGGSESGDETLNADLVLVGSGDRAALSRLYDALSPTMFALALRLLNREDRAEEATTDAWLTIWQCAPRLPQGRARQAILAATVRSVSKLARVE